MVVTSKQQRRVLQSEVENSNFGPLRLSVHNNQIFGICSTLCVLGTESKRFQVYLTAVFSKYVLQPSKHITFLKFEFN